MKHKVVIRGGPGLQMDKHPGVILCLTLIVYGLFTPVEDVGKSALLQR